ncbi:MAG: hypothetical protein GF375_01580 [Candidatus Omnitrophica bacterium]|nr:hypothetical protein [Candidatus Omnitrophota bacterium]MBD3268819.1 hypothetical protein [Candidatus Omnitrophota bacterium]
MLPVGMLMKEHRIIEEMIKLMLWESARLKEGRKPDINFIDKVIDFIKVYADECHHGKEEDILFKELKEKPISQKHKKIMEELLDEHVFGRQVLASLAEAKKKYLQGDKESVSLIEKNMHRLIDFYPAHIDKEDNHFFLPVMEYFDEREKEEMVCRCREFDMKMIHQKYKGVIEEIKKRR